MAVGAFATARRAARPVDVAGWLRPLGVGEILDVAIKAYRARFSTLVKAVAVVIVPVVAIDALVQLSLLPDSAELGTDRGAFDDPTGMPNADVGDLWALIAGLLLVGLLSMVASQLAVAASFKVRPAHHRGSPGARAARPAAAQRPPDPPSSSRWKPSLRTRRSK